METAVKTKNITKTRLEKAPEEKKPEVKRPSIFEHVDEIIDRYDADPRFLINILLDLQLEEGYLRRAHLGRTAKRLGLTMPEVYEKAAIYKEFKFTPRKKHKVNVCMCSVCYVNGQKNNLEVIERVLGIKPGETTDDGEIELTTVPTLHNPAKGPNIEIDEELHSGMTPKKTRQLFLRREVIPIN